MLHHLVMIYTFNNIAECFTAGFFSLHFELYRGSQKQYISFELNLFGENVFLVYSQKIEIPDSNFPPYSGDD